MKSMVASPVVKWMAIAVVIYVAAMISAEFLPGLGVFMVACLRLVIGWLIFAAGTLPKVQWEAAPLVNGLVSISLALLLLHAALVHLSKARASRPWRWKWSAILACVPVILFGVCLSAAGAVTHASLLLDGDIARSQDPRINLIRDLTNAKQLLAIQGAASWSDVQRETQTGADELMALARLRSLPVQEPPELWIWLPRCEGQQGGEVPVLVSPRPHRPGKRLIGFADGSARECSEHEYEEAISRWHEACARSLLKAQTPDGQKGTPR